MPFNQGVKKLIVTAKTTVFRYAQTVTEYLMKYSSRSCIEH
jgi:hypothetical protein